MGLYRQVAGGSVGLFLEEVEAEMTNGGGGGTVFYDAGMSTITPSMPLEPGEPGGTTSVPPIDTSQPVTESIQTAMPDTGTPVSATPIPGTGGENNWLAAISLGALIVNMVYGEQLLKKYRSAAFVGGLGALWYGLSQTDKQDAPTPIT